MDDMSIAMLEARTRRVGEQMKKRRTRSLNQQFRAIHDVLSLAFNTETGTVPPTSIPPLDGDVDGALTATIVRAIQGIPVSPVDPTTGQALIFDGTSYVPQTGSGGHAITEEGGAALTARTILNFVGALITATDDPGNGRTNITVTDPVPAHVALGDPHPQYTDVAELATALAVYIAKSLIDAKGDLLVGTADNTVSRLGVGANGTSPIADSTQTTGIRWGTVVTTMWVPVSNGDPDFPELVFDANGDVVMAEVSI